MFRDTSTVYEVDNGSLQEDGAGTALPRNARKDHDDRARAPVAGLSAACFATGSLIATINGLRPAEELAVGDLILTADHGYQPLRWCHHHPVDASVLLCNSDLMPIRISTDAFGVVAPVSDLLVAPWHRVLIRSKVAYRMFGEYEVLVPASALLGLPGVEVAVAHGPIAYHQLGFDHHEIIYANGIPAESVFTGDLDLDRMPEDRRAALLDLWPDLADGGPSGQLARVVPPRARQLHRLVERHRTNSKVLLDQTL